MKRKNEGITLIALIITVIVLIILAGVTINMVIGDNGIINKAKEAKESSKRGEAEEEIYLYWGEGEIEYEDTIEEKVEKLKEKMQEKDIDATASIGENEIEIKYKGYDFKIPYKDKETSEEITYITAFVGGKDSSDHKIIYVYLTKSGKLYITDNETNKICINDKYPELSGENNLKIQELLGLSKEFSFLYSEKKLWEITIKSKEIQNIFDLNNYEIINILDLETIENGKYKNNNIRNFFEGIILDDGNFYVPTEENTLQEIKIPQLENIKIYNYGKGIIDNQSCLIIIDETGKMYNFETGNELSSTYANGFFSDKKVIYCCTYKKSYNDYNNVFVTEEGRLYLTDIETGEILFKSEENDILKNKKIKNAYYFSDKFEEKYIIIIMENGEMYCTKDMSEFKKISENNFPELNVEHQ